MKFTLTTELTEQEYFDLTSSLELQQSELEARMESESRDRSARYEDLDSLIQRIGHIKDMKARFQRAYFDAPHEAPQTIAGIPIVTVQGMTGAVITDGKNSVSIKTIP